VSKNFEFRVQGYWNKDKDKNKKKNNNKKNGKSALEKVEKV